MGSLLYILRHYHELRWSKDEGAFSLPHCAKLCSMGIPMGLQCSLTAIGSVVLQGAVNGLGSDIVAAQTAGGKAAQFLSVPDVYKRQVVVLPVPGPPVRTRQFSVMALRMASFWSCLLYTSRCV